MNDQQTSSNSVDIMACPSMASRRSVKVLLMMSSNELKRLISCDKTIDNGGNRPFSSFFNIVK